MDSLITDLLGDFESNVTKVQEKIGDVAAKEICLQFFCHWNIYLLLILGKIHFTSKPIQTTTNPADFFHDI